MTRAAKATASERVKASRLRKLPSLNREQTLWLNRYQERHPAQVGRSTPPDKPEAPSGSRVSAPVMQASPSEPASPGSGYEAPPAVTLDTGHELADLRELDAPVPPPPAEAPSVAPIGPMDRDPHAPCGVCSSCRSEVPIPTCPKSGQVIPRPLDARASNTLAAQLLGAIAFGLGAAYQVASEPASPQQRETLAAGLAQLSERYDLSAAHEMMPYLLILQSAGVYTVSTNSKNKAKKKAKEQAKRANAFGAPPPVNVQ